MQKHEMQKTGIDLLMHAMIVRERDACCQLLESWGYEYVATRIREERARAEAEEAARAKALDGV